MKNKILPLSLVTLVVFLGAFLISATFTESIFQFSGEGDQVAKASEQLAKVRNNQLTGLINPADVINAREQAEKIAAQKGYAADLEWSFLGPNNRGGATNAIMYDNQDDSYSTIIAGSFFGGLYKSTNNGLTWNKINGIQENLRVSCIVQLADGTIFVGTGGKSPGSGIYKSTDGETFTVLPATDPAQGGEGAFSFVNDLKVNPLNGALVASTEFGIYFSASNGDTWYHVKDTDGNDLDGYSSTISIGSDGITAVSMNGLCYISDNGAADNFVLHSNDTFNLPYENVGVLELAVAPSDPNILYATPLSLTTSEMINLYRSDDRGVHWRIIAPGGSELLPLGFTPENNVLEVFPANADKILVGGFDLWEGAKINETGYYQWVQKSSGFLPPEVFPSYIHTFHYNYVFRPNNVNEFLIGHNGGVSRGLVGSVNYDFFELNKTYNTSQAMYVGFGGELKTVLGGFDQDGIQSIHGHGNPASSTDGSQIWGMVPPWSGGNGGECFISTISPDVYIYNLNGINFRRSEDQGENFSNTFLSSSIVIPDDAQQTPCLYWENYENEYSRDTTIFVAKSELASGTEVKVHSNNRDYPFPYTLPAVMNAGDTMKVKDIVSTKYFITTLNAVWMTFDVLDFGGEPEWFKIADKASSGFDGEPSSIAMSTDANYVFIGTMDGQLYRIANIKYAYDFERADISSAYSVIATAKIDFPGANGQSITSIYVDPNDNNHMILTLGNYGNDHYVYRSTNALDEAPVFTSIQGNLPKMPVFSSIIEMSDANTAIIGSDLGVYISTNINDASPSWELGEGAVGNAPILQLKQQLIAQNPVEVKIFNGVDTIVETYQGTTNYGVIYAAAYGRGLFYTTQYQKPVGIFTPSETIHAASLKVYPNPASTQATIEYSIEKKAEVVIAVFDINGKMVLNEKLSKSAGTHQYKLDCSSLPRGTYITSVHTGQAIKTGKFIVVR